MKTATFVKDIRGFQGDARLYKLSEPLITENYDYDNDKQKTVGYNYVVVSAAIVPYSGPETYIFGADKSGNVLSWTDLDGSFRGGLDHVRALHNAGYGIVE